MKNLLHKSLAALVLLAAIAFSSCTDSVPSEDFGMSPESNNAGVFFHEDITNYSPKTAHDTLKLAIGRINSDLAASYKIKGNVADSAGHDASNYVILPEATNFAAGQATDTVSIILNGIPYNTDYKVSLSFDAADASQYALSSIEFSIYCEDPDAWELLTDKAIFINNFWSSILSGSTTGYRDVKVKKYKGRDLFRIYGLPATFRYEWTTLFELAPDCELTVDEEEYAIEIDCEKYSDPKSKIKKLYMPFQSLGVKLNQMDGAAYAPGEVYAGSVAYNLQSASTGDYMTEGQYPLGTYDTSTGVFKFGNIAVDYGDDLLGIQLCRSEVALYLDESKMETDIRDLQYKNIRRATYHSRAYLESDGSYMAQGTKLGQCVDEEYEDAENTYRITAPYVSGIDLYFTHNKKTGKLKFLPGQQVGSTALGGYPILCESNTTTYTKTDSTEFYTFNMTFYYINDEGNRYDLGTFKEKLELGSEISYFTADDLVPNTPLDAYVGTWTGEFLFINDLNSAVKSTVTIEKDDDYTLLIRGLAPYMESEYGYDSSLYLDWNDETGVFDFSPQYANTFNSYQINVYTANLDDPNSELYEANSLRVGMLNDGRIAFVNDPNNNQPVNCAVFYTPAQGGALVEPFIPYNLVLEKDESAEEAKAEYPANAKAMTPWRNFNNYRRGQQHSNGIPAFGITQGTTSTSKFYTIKKSNLTK